MRVLGSLFLLIAAALGVYRYLEPAEVFAFGTLSGGFALLGLSMLWFGRVLAEAERHPVARKSQSVNQDALDRAVQEALAEERARECQRRKGL